MKFCSAAALTLVAAASPAAAFAPHSSLNVRSASSGSRSSQLSMVLEKPKKLSKLEILKTESDHLQNPLKEVSGDT